MAETSPPPTRRFQPTPVEETVKRVRRFAVEPVETSIRSSKKQVKKEHDVSRVANDESTVERKDFAGKKRFLPTPVETTFKSSKLHSGNPTTEPTTASFPGNPSPPETPKPRKKFAPQLIETSRRSKRAGDTTPATLPTDKTDLTPGVPNIYTRPKRKVVRTPVAPGNTPSSTSISIQSIVPYPPRRQGSMRPHLNTRRSTRQDSFQPELEAIASGDSGENSNNSDEEEEEPDRHSSGESTPSLTGSFTSSDDSLMRLQLARTRESCDDRFSGYLLALAAKAAEKQLREQALAAFPNESLHEIVEHFYDREIDPPSDEESVEGIGMLLDDPNIPATFRRKSTEVGWAAKEMQQHQEKLNRLREEETQKKIAAEASKPTFKDPFWTNGMTSKASPFNCVNDEKVVPSELRCMRSAASPPMLGANLKFRMCPSPKATKFETDQKVNVQHNKSEAGGGLWGGYCIADEPGECLSASTKGPTMIHTPHPEREDAVSCGFTSELPASGAKTPRSRDSGIRMLAGIDERLKAEVEKSRTQEALQEEFDDTFVTQVYNYLSLGYPALARKFDEELARISRISEKELSIDDSKKHAKGYIGIANGSGSPGAWEKKNGNGAPDEGYCARWKALRVYILEWARQHPSMSNGAMGPSAWGVRARRGSWAI